MISENKPAAILLDLDDTLIAWDMVADQSWKKACWDFADTVKGLRSDVLVQNINHVREWYFSNPERHKYARLNLLPYRQEIVKLAFSRLGIDNDRLAGKIAAAYGTERENAAYVIPGTIKSLQCWKRQRVRLALVTNGTGEMQRWKINRFALSRYFDYILIESEFGFGKPEKKVFTKVLKELNINASQAWMVGDNLEFDVGGAQNAGLYSIWVDWQNKGLPEFSPVVPDKIIKNVTELIPQRL